MCGTKNGFTLIEILIALMIIGIMAVVVVPNFIGRAPRYEREEFVRRLNALTRFGWQNAIISNKVHRVFFDFKKRQVRLEIDQERKDKKGDRLFTMVKGYSNRLFSIPKQLQVKNFIIEGIDEAKRGRKLDEVWFFVVPEGLAQSVIINLVDKKDVLDDGKSRPVGLRLNQFSAQFKVYDTMQK